MKRKRRGSTSPPLACIERNPGPRTSAKRKDRKDRKTPSFLTAKKPKRESSKHHTPEELEQLQEDLDSGKSQFCVIVRVYGDGWKKKR